jgi:hypothetical protein
MQSGLRPKGAAAWRGNRRRASAKVSALISAIVVVAGTASGCAPAYYDSDAAMFDAAAAGPRSPSRARTRVSLPGPGLLKPQAPPDCGEGATADPRLARDSNRVTSAAVSQQATLADAQRIPDAEQADPNAELAMRIKIEYERECYRQAEARVRARLQQLQQSVGETVKSVNRVEQQGR